MSEILRITDCGSGSELEVIHFIGEVSIVIGGTHTHIDHVRTLAK